MKKRIGILALLLVMVISVGILAGCTARDNNTGRVYAAEPSEDVSLTLYFGNEQADALVKETRVVKRSDVPIELVVLNEIIKGPESPSARISIPKEAKVLSVRVDDKIAYVDFSREVVENHWGGSAGDAMTIGSIVHSLTELPGIEKVQLLLEGKVEYAMFGHIATDLPIGR